MRWVVFTLCLLVGIPAASTAMAPPPVPDALRALVQEFPPLEEAFRRHKWEKAQQRLQKINVHYAKALPELMHAVAEPEQRNKVSQFGFLLKDLNKQLTAREQDKAEKSFHLFGGLIIELIDFFHYETHPLLVVFAKKCAKMMNMTELDKITSEMIEMQSSVKRMTPSLQKRGVSQERIDTSFKQLASVIKAASDNNQKEVSRHLIRLRQTYLNMGTHTARH